MLKKEHRLTRTRFMRVLKTARLHHGTYLSLKTAPTPAASRFSVVTPKRLAPRAVDRNRLRRRVYRAVAEHTFPKQGVGGIFFMKREAARATYQELRDDVGILFRRARIT